MALKYPKNESVWVSYLSSKQDLLFVLTSNKTRDTYFLYEVVGDELKRLGKARTPTELEEKSKVHEKMCESQLKM